MSGRNHYLKRHTDLGKFSHGNFDFNFSRKNPAVTIVMRVNYQFEKGISKADRRHFKAKMQRAVTAFWHDKAELVPSDGSGSRIPVRMMLQENKNDYHKLVDVEKSRSRPWVGSDLNLAIGDSIQTLAHELGHAMTANYDEYDATKGAGGFLGKLGGWLENRAYWHDNRFHHEAHKVLMGTGTELRPRYFDHFAEEVSGLLGEKYTSRLLSSTPGARSGSSGPGKSATRSGHSRLIDLDGDGKPDLAPSGRTFSSGRLNSLLDLDGDGKPDLAPRGRTFSSGRLNSLLDLDGDGKPDLAPSGRTFSSGRLSSLLDLDGDGKPDLAPRGRTFSSGRLGSLVDFDGDGKPDLVTGRLQTRWGKSGRLLGGGSGGLDGNGNGIPDWMERGPANKPFNNPFNNTLNNPFKKPFKKPFG